MLKACIDTNVWLSGLVFSGPPAEIVDLALKRRFEVILSTAILNEFHHNLIKKFDVTQRAASRLRYRIAQIADLYEPRGEVRVIPGQHADNLILETAWLGRAKYLVTGDREHLLPLKRFKNTRIIEPA